MRTYTCDKCGAEAKHNSGIVGKEFDRQGFETLAPAYRWPGVVDVCSDCFKTLQQAVEDAENETKQLKRLGFLARLGIVT